MNLNDWKDDEVLRAVDLHEAGYTAKSIAVLLNEEFGTTRSRNAVIGRLYRLRKES